ncbi:pyridoxal phosphate-dependent aminotransferase [Burkholderiales bacterium GJ-E10]|nr:pyridoxal phosphate-dependent aminotransferase [Burkholderiales bacterium GJ-E10]
MNSRKRDDWIRLFQSDVGVWEMEAVLTAMRSGRLSHGELVESFEENFADYVGRTYAVAVSSGTAALLLSLRALGIGPGDEVIASPYSWHQIAHAVALVGATPVFADMDYWSGTLQPAAAASRITPRTKAILAGNTNGHPAPWQGLRELSAERNLTLLEDSTEAIGSVYQGRRTGAFGRCAIFDFSQASALACGEGGMVVTDDPGLATELRHLRSHRIEDRLSVSVGGRVPLQAGMSEIAAALGLAQLDRIDEILAQRKKVESHYLRHIQSFEGIKPPYLAPDVDEIHWFSYVVHLGTRFTRSARNQILEDLATEGVEAAAYCNPLHLQFFYNRFGYRKGNLPTVERIADRAIALPFHGSLREDEVMFVVGTAKDSSANVGAGAAIY